MSHRHVKSVFLDLTSTHHLDKCVNRCKASATSSGLINIF